MKKLSGGAYITVALLVWAFVVAFSVGCSGPLAQGHGGFDIPKEQQSKLLRAKEGCELMGGKFFVQVDTRAHPPTYDILCDLPNER